jgi:hypothetical protein
MMNTYFIIKKYKNVIKEVIHFSSRILFYLVESLQSRIKANFMKINKIKNVKNVRCFNNEES